MVGIDSNVSVVVGLDTLRTIIGIYMDVHRTCLHVSFNKVGLVLVEEVVDFAVVD